MVINEAASIEPLNLNGDRLMAETVTIPNEVENCYECRYLYSIVKETRFQLGKWKCTKAKVRVTTPWRIPANCPFRTP